MINCIKEIVEIKEVLPVPLLGCILRWLSVSLCVTSIACYEENGRLKGICFDTGSMTINYFNGDPIDHVEFYRDGDADEKYIIGRRLDAPSADSGTVFF